MRLYYSMRRRRYIDQAGGWRQLTINWEKPVVAVVSQAAPAAAASGSKKNKKGEAGREAKDPGLKEIWETALAIRTEKPTTPEGPRDADPAMLFAQNAIKLALQGLSEWSRKYQRDPLVVGSWDHKKRNAENRAYLKMAEAAWLSYGWLADLYDEGLFSFVSLCRMAAADPDVIREQILAACDPRSLELLAPQAQAPGTRRACQPLRD